MRCEAVVCGARMELRAMGIGLASFSAQPAATALALALLASAACSATPQKPAPRDTTGLCAASSVRVVGADPEAALPEPRAAPPSPADDVRARGALGSVDQLGPAGLLPSGRVEFLAASRDGELVAAATDLELAVFERQSGELVARTDLEVPGRNGRILMDAQGVVWMRTSSGPALYRWQPGGELTRLTPRAEALNEHFPLFRLTDDGERVIAFGRVWSDEATEPVGPPDVELPRDVLAIDSTGSVALTATVDWYEETEITGCIAEDRLYLSARELALQSVETGDLLLEVPALFVSGVPRPIALAASGPILVALEEQVAVIDRESGRLLPPLEVANVSYLRLLPELGEVVLRSGRGGAELWQIAPPRREASLSSVNVVWGSDGAVVEDERPRIHSALLPPGVERGRVHAFGETGFAVGGDVVFFTSDQSQVEWVTAEAQSKEPSLHGSEVVSVAISADGQRLLSSDMDGATRLTTLSGTTLPLAEDGCRYAASVYFIMDDQRSARVCGHDASFWDTATGRFVGSLSSDRGVTAITEQGGVFVGRLGGLWDVDDLELWSAVTGECVTSYGTARAEECAQTAGITLASSDDLGTALFLRVECGAAGHPSALVRYRPQERDWDASVGIPLVGVGYTIERPTPGGERVVQFTGGYETSTLSLWQLGDAEPLFQRTFAHNVHRLAIAPGGHRIAAVDEAGELWVLDATGEDLGALTVDDDGVSAVAFSETGRWLALGTRRGRLLRVELEDP